jgi:stage II sporulation protein D
MTRNLRAITLTLLLLLGAGTATAEGAARFTIRGAGFGHGVGMSQYGAMGAASQGWDYRTILNHYYTSTALATLDAPREVRVLLQAQVGSAAFSGANAGGDRELSPARVYYARARGAGVQLLSARGRVLATVAPPLRVTGPGLLVLHGRAGNGRTNGAYRGALEFRPGAGGGTNAINALALDDYVQGVVPTEVPASWPAEALKAQAVAARTYAVTTSKAGAGFDQYPDTRSQVYGGAGVETAATNAATQATRAELVTYQGTPVTTFYFSTSGGRTESIEKSVFASLPRPWLQSVDDPFDSVSPKHRWGPIRMTVAAAGARLRGLVKGRFKGVQVVQRGDSPRVLAADVLGSRGRTRVTGATLRARFGLYDTWAYFTAIRSVAAPAPTPATPPTASGTGGVGPAGGTLAVHRRAAAGLRGYVLPARRGARLTVERRAGNRWVRVARVRAGAGGRYRARVAAPGLYRVRSAGQAGPAVRVR